MPVFLQGTAQTAPEQQSVLQPAPVDPAVKKLKDAKTNVELYQKRVKITSSVLIAVGGIGMVSSFYHMMTAGKHADDMINGHHRPHPGPGPHPHPNKTEEMEGAPKYVTHEQFELYDTLKTLASIMFFIFAKVMAVGKCGRWMAWRNNSDATKRLGKKSLLGFVLIIIMSLFAAHQGHHIKNIMEKVHPDHKGGKHHMRGGRHLEEDLVSQTSNSLLMSILKDQEATCSAHGDENSCNADGPCSWCDAGAVRPACHSIENAKILPPAVFQCSKLSEEPKKEEPKPIVKDDEAQCGNHPDDGSCNADDLCSWCMAGAVPPACHSIENAKILPPAVFQCSKLDAQPKKEEPKPIVKDQEATCSAHGDENSCNADGPCSWCDAGAVRPACHSIENAKRLPPAVFMCSKLSEKPIVKDDEEMCNAYAETDCMANNKCSWCKAGAVRDACHSVDNAKMLPPAVFDCSNIGQEPEEMFFQEAEKMIERSHEMFNRMVNHMDRFTEIVRGPTEETCSTYSNTDSCHAGGCSWCDAAAVRPACHTIENAGTLPPAVFECTPLPSMDEDVEEEEGPADTLFGQWMQNLQGKKHGRGGRHHGGKHHGGKHHGGRHHQRGERPPMVDDEPETFYGRPRVHAERESFEKKGDHGHHGKHHGFKRLGLLCCILTKVLAIAHFGAHFYFIRCLKNEQMKLEKITGKKEGKWGKWGKCGWKKKFQQPQAQQPVVEYSPVLNATTESSIEEISEDKEIGVVYAPNPTGFQANQN